MRRILLALFTTVVGCSLDSEGTAGDLPSVDPDTGSLGADTAVAVEDTAVVEDTVVEDSTAVDTTVADTTVTDSGVVDTTVADTAVADTFVPADTAVADTFIADTFVADTFVADTAVADTFVADTFVADTAVADTFVADTYVPPLLTCAATAPTSSVSVNLTTEGTIDWAHWGQGANPGNWNHKSGGTAITKGTATSPTWWGAYPTKFSWSNGAPTANVTDTQQGIYLNGKGDTFVFDAAGDPAAVRTLVVYAAWNGSTGTIDAKLSDSSVTGVSALIPPSGVSSGTGIQPELYTCKFRPATAGAKLQITITQTSGGIGAGYTSLLAASLR